MEPSTLDSQVCFALHAAARTAVNAYRAELDKLNVTYTQYVTLLTLFEQDGQTVSELGARLLLDSGTLSPLLKRMQVLGLVERRRDADDERRVSVHLTEAGRAMRPRIASMQQAMGCSLQLSEPELVLLRELATKFARQATPHQSSDKEIHS